jgi:hypothetical protein
VTIGEGGVGSGGDLNLAGEGALASSGFGPGRPTQSKGGNSFLGKSPRARTSIGLNGSSPSVNAYGAGSTGPVNRDDTATTKVGADGADGIVIVELYA